MVLALLLLACSSPPAGGAAKVAASSAAPTERTVESPHTERLRGICDGSAAVRLPDDGLLVGYDEDRALHRFGPGGTPRADVALSPLLGLPDGPEFDLEGAALVPGPASETRIWWVGSHGRNGSDEVAPARHTFFATNVPATDALTDLAILEAPIDLMPVLMAHPHVSARLGGPVLDRGAKAGGVNIEALAVHPEGGLAVGFRSPLSADDGLSGTALLVHIDRGDGPWRVMSAHEVDLGGRGFRDLVVDGEGWRVVAGPVDDGPFALFRLDATYQPTPWLDGEALGGLRPEALVPARGGWLLLSDDGKVKRPDPTAKDGDRGCDKLRREHGRGHPEVYLRARFLPEAR